MPWYPGQIPRVLFSSKFIICNENLRGSRHELVLIIEPSVCYVKVCAIVIELVMEGRILTVDISANKNHWRINSTVFIQRWSTPFLYYYLLLMLWIGIVAWYRIIIVPDFWRRRLLKIFLLSHLTSMDFAPISLGAVGGRYSHILVHIMR